MSTIEITPIQQFNCRHQTRAGNEAACCRFLWTMVIMDPRYAALAAKRNIAAGRAPTACTPGMFGRNCFGEED